MSPDVDDCCQCRQDGYATDRPNIGKNKHPPRAMILEEISSIIQAEEHPLALQNLRRKPEVLPQQR
jgi:hypothetical protein